MHQAKLSNVLSPINTFKAVRHVNRHRQLYQIVTSVFLAGALVNPPAVHGLRPDFEPPKYDRKITEKMTSKCEPLTDFESQMFELKYLAAAIEPDVASWDNEMALAKTKIIQMKLVELQSLAIIKGVLSS